ncbi:Glycosyltransferase involved in cell wall bisynthesis [Pseudarcicella hirudinis]|uniref:Glycosyltransferase involved in cell wall bisynthesis n=1 Tax=Pseudarcicella hirudinis TaxID=1079859 RepID=A0A1I5YF44_9BACT|nr:glycosyltransferase family 2 protein [Pseudarcicella hirudinis]SFQ42841.1 Glycosyltransferase involved in cell wall bisynthesis [Pseudarcicella hirudinis]
MLDISVIVPLYNEEESLPELATWISKVMDEHKFSYEVIFVNDGSRDKSWNVIRQISLNNPNFKGISFSRNYGKSAALHTGFKAAEGRVVITMDADLQDSPDEIPELYRMITEEDFDLVSGWKQKRFDPISKTIPTKLYNAVTRSISGVYLHDFNCGLKAYKKEVIKTIRLYGEMHRYIPVQANWNGFSKIGEKVVNHQARKYGTTKFGLERFLYGFLDLLSITFIQKFGKRPMHFFGTMGILAILAGGFSAFWILGEKWWDIAHNLKYRNATDHPFFYLALTSVIIGTQLFLAGFLGELLTTNSDRTTDYQIKETTGEIKEI